MRSRVDVMETHQNIMDRIQKKSALENKSPSEEEIATLLNSSAILNEHSVTLCSNRNI